MGSTLGLRGQRLGRGKIVGFAPGYLAGAATARVQAANNLTISASRAAAVTMQPSVAPTPIAPAPTIGLPSDYGAQVQGNISSTPNFNGIWG